MKESLKNLLFRNKFKIVILANITVGLFDGKAQVNLVGNPSFEQFYTTCTGPNFVSKLKYWNGMDSMYAVGAGFCYNTCYLNVPNTGQGYQNPKTGNGFIRLQAYCTNPCSFYSSRTYAKNRLLTNLTSGKTYCVKMFANLQNTSAEAIDALQILLSDLTIDTIKYGNMPLTYLTPQITNTVGIIADTLNWIEIKGTFIASGTEKYLVVGDFKTDAVTSASSIPTGASGGNWSEYFIDDVSVIDFNLSAYAGPDQYINLGDSAFIGRPPEVGLECTWTTGTTTIGSGGGIWVKPTSSGTYSYIVTQNICGNIKTDTVLVLTGTGINENIAFANSISIYPQPTKDLLNINLNHYYEPTVQVKISDLNGKIISHVELQTRNGKTVLETSDLSNGVYFLMIQNSANQTAIKKLVIAK